MVSGGTTHDDAYPPTQTPASDVADAQAFRARAERQRAALDSHRRHAVHHRVFAAVYGQLVVGDGDSDSDLLEHAGVAQRAADVAAHAYRPFGWHG